MTAGRARARIAVSSIPLIWRLRMALHGVRLCPVAYGTGAQGPRRLPAYRVTMSGELLRGAEQAPLHARVNIRAASFVLRTFGLHAAEIRADADGAVQAIDPGHATAARHTGAADRGVASTGYHVNG